IFLVAMTNGVMTGKLLAYTMIHASLISHEFCLARDVLAHDRDDTRNAGVLDMEAASRTAALDKGKDNVFVTEAAFRLWLTFQTPNVSLIGFDNLTGPAHW